jgi:PAS domain S-box-containing protein
MIEDNEFYWKLLDTLEDGVYFANEKKTITYWNKAAEEITGYKSAEVLGKSCEDKILVHIDEKGKDLCTGLCPLGNAIKNQLPYEANIFLLHKGGYRVPVHVRVNPIINSKGGVMGAVEIFSHRSSKDIINKRFKSLGDENFTDPIVKLPNQSYLQMNLKTRFFEFRNYEWPFGILYIKISTEQGRTTPMKTQNFEEVLKIAGESFLNTLNPYDIIGRWGPDEFLGIFINVDQKRLEEIDEFYQVILGRANFSSTGFNISIFTGATLGQQDDQENTILERAKSTLKKVEISK